MEIDILPAFSHRLFGEGKCSDVSMPARCCCPTSLSPPPLISVLNKFLFGKSSASENPFLRAALLNKILDLSTVVGFVRSLLIQLLGFFLTLPSSFGFNILGCKKSCRAIIVFIVWAGVRELGKEFPVLNCSIIIRCSALFLAQMPTQKAFKHNNTTEKRCASNKS